MSTVLRVAHAPPEPVLVYDGDCRFCLRRAKRWERLTGNAVRYLALQSPEAAARFPELSRTQLEQAVHLIGPDGSVYRGAEAVFRLLAFKNRFPLWLYRTVPGFPPGAEWFYRFVARHRQRACKASAGASPQCDA